jgi:D-tyrosyl-tRNA(Tyr) deacylase
MRAVVQRVSSARVLVDGQVVGQIGRGLLVYLSVADGDREADLAYTLDKVRHLRIFADSADKMNLDVCAAGGSVLVVSAFTLHGDARKGRRPSFDAAAEPAAARDLYEQFCQCLAQTGVAVEQGRFAARMQVESVNDGPISILLDSAKIL